MTYSPPGFQTNTLSPEFRTMIQKTKEEWLGNLPTEEVGDCLPTLHSGTQLLRSLIDQSVDVPTIQGQVLSSLEMGDGNVDLIEAVAKMTKKVILDVIAEFGQDRENR